MKQGYTFLLGIVVLCYFSACQQKMVCPAYHSYFILDVDETRKTFTMFGNDSLPRKNWEVEKEKYGVAKEISLKKKTEDMRIISMNSVYKKLEDPFEQFRREPSYYQDSSVVIDSASVLAASRGDNDFQNIDQMIYLHHFGKYLPRRGEKTIDDEIQEDLQEDIKSDLEPENADQEGEEIEEDKKKKKFGLFGKKKKKKKNKNKESEEPNLGEEPQ